MNEPSLKKPLIFVGPPCSGVGLISNLVFHHPALCWLDEKFEKYPTSNFQRKLFKYTNEWRSKANDYPEKSLMSALANDFSPTPAEATLFWDSMTRDDVDFYRGFARGKQASPMEITEIKKIFEDRMRTTKKERLALKFTGPARLYYLQSLFPDAKFVHVMRDPASTVNSIISSEEWEFKGKNMLWWRGAYSLQELAQYDLLRRHAVAGTAFQLNKLLQTTRQEIDELDIDLLTINYEDFVANPSKTLLSILDYAELDPHSNVERAMKRSDIRCSNSVLKMPATDINTVYTWCPAA
ncbi:sulfotransferase family protein [Enterovibrio nigricans]|uniref:Sulfotransferase family protein n=1 Tax=Enterovibrio nigricans DSM 22720 TaxID=1121868 RepID=A0A1T4UY43_9GAMM|nr:sulfotransferase [Enterovibrio nigricans]PKF50775.1 sulfotransferase [Enterovibrio nigricans]SKA57649.1 Sulfotransferase family protein [Enterovibrio nigricans DSM 22720]